MAGPHPSWLDRFRGDKRSYTLNSLISLGGYAITSALTFLFGIVSARALGPTGNGVLSLFLVLVSTVPVILNIGLGQAAVFAVNRYKASIRGVTSELWTVAWLWGGVAAAGVAVSCVLWNLHSPGGALNPLLISAAVLLTPPLLAKHYSEYIYASLHRFGWNAMVLISELALRLVLFAAFMSWPGGIEGAVLAVVIASLGATALGWCNIIVNFGIPRMAPRLRILRPLFSYGWVNHFSVLLAHLNLRVDQFLIAAALPVRELGIYVTAVTLAELPIKIATALSKVLFAKVASSSGSEATQLTSATLRILMTLAWIIAAIVWLLREQLVVVVYGRGYKEAGQALVWLLPGAVLFNYVQILGSDLAGRGYPNASVLAGAVGLITGVVANLILIPRLGIAGAAISTSLGYVLNSVVVIFRYCRLTGESPWRLVFATRSDVRAITFWLMTYIGRTHG